MRFSTTLLLSALAALTNAQANPFTRVTYAGITVGTTVNITWTPTSLSTITLLLVQGNPGALTTIGSIVSALPNQGYYLWTPATTIVKDTDYAIEIVDDSNKYNTNYTPEFAIDSPLLASVSAGTAATASVTALGTATAGTAAATAATTGLSVVTVTGGKTTVVSTATGSAATAKASSTSEGAAVSVRSGVGLVLGVVGAVMAIL